MKEGDKNGRLKKLNITTKKLECPKDGASYDCQLKKDTFVFFLSIK